LKLLNRHNNPAIQVHPENGEQPASSYCRRTNDNFSLGWFLEGRRGESVAPTDPSTNTFDEPYFYEYFDTNPPIQH